MANCPRFWRNRKVEIRLLDLTEAKYLDAILMETPYIIIATSLLIGILNFVYVWQSSNLKDVYKQNKRMLTKVYKQIKEGDGMVPNCVTRLFCKLANSKAFPKYFFIIYRIIWQFTMPLIDTVAGKSI